MKDKVPGKAAIKKPAARVPAAAGTKVPSNEARAAKFVEQLFESTDHVRFRLIESWTDDNGKPRSRALESPCETAAKALNPSFLKQRLAKAAEKQANVYFGVCPRFGPDGFDLASQIRVVRTLWADIDQCSVEDALGRCRDQGVPLPSIAVNSGNGVHLYWLLKDPYLIDDVGDPPQVETEVVVIKGVSKSIQFFRAPGSDELVYLHDPKTGLALPSNRPALSLKAAHFQDIVKGISLRLGGDKNAHDLARLLRLPGTMNRKNERNGATPKPCQVKELDPNLRYSVEDFASFAGTASGGGADEAKAAAARKASNPPGTLKTVQGVRAASTATGLTDDQIIRNAKEAQNGDKFQMLWNGDHSEYPSQSEADLALCSLLAFWTGPDKEQIRRLFLRSGLCREKSRRADYLDRTIDKALAGRTEFYSPNAILEGTPEVGSRLITNFGRADDGKQPPLPMSEILAQIESATEGWPRRVGSRLFVASPGRVEWLDKAAALTGYLGSAAGVPPKFRGGAGFHTKEEVFHELRRLAKAYGGIEVVPHEPLVPGIYYACEVPPAGDGSALKDLVDRFAPYTPEDRHLLTAFFVTCIWGGTGGQRPAFVIGAPGGRGHGKSFVAKVASRLCGGHLALDKGVDVDSFKTRLLSPDGLGKRIVLLDNLKSMKLSWPEVESMITASVISGRALYVGEYQRPNYFVWTITVNGANFSTDMAQRCVVIELDEPTYGATWEEDIYRYVDENREAIIGDAIAFLRHAPSPLKAYSRWAAWEAAVLSKLPNPDTLQSVILKRQVGTDVEEEEAEIFEAFVEKRLKDAGIPTDCSRVHIPSSIAAAFYDEAMNDRQSTSKTSRWLNQKIEEKAFKHLQLSLSKKIGRGLIWNGEKATPADTIRRDLEERLSKLKARPSW